MFKLQFKLVGDLMGKDWASQDAYGSHSSLQLLHLLTIGVLSKALRSIRLLEVLKCLPPQTPTDRLKMCYSSEIKIDALSTCDRSVVAVLVFGGEEGGCWVESQFSVIVSRSIDSLSTCDR